MPFTDEEAQIIRKYAAEYAIEENLAEYQQVIARSDGHLRDMFAGQALAALGASFLGGGWHNPNKYQIEVIASGAYSIADAMMAERKK